MDAKHTPGPWIVDAMRENTSFVDAPGIRESIAQVFNGDHGDLPHEANARLIAAAPELYEALKDCEASLERVAEGGIISMAEALGACRKARAALLKASPDKSMEQV